MIMEKLIRRIYFTGLILLWLMLPVTESPAQAIDEVSFRDLVTADMLYNFVDTLSSDEFEGRLTGDDGFDKAAGWVIQHFKAWDVKPLGSGGATCSPSPIRIPIYFRDVRWRCTSMEEAGKTTDMWRISSRAQHQGMVK